MIFPLLGFCTRSVQLLILLAFASGCNSENNLVGTWKVKKIKINNSVDGAFTHLDFTNRQVLGDSIVYAFLHHPYPDEHHLPMDSSAWRRIAHLRVKLVPQLMLVVNQDSSFQTSGFKEFDAQLGDYF